MSTLRADFEHLWSQVGAVGADRVRGGYSRHGFDAADAELRTWFVEQAEKRGLDVETDRNGNMWAWWGADQPGKVIVTGSHLDSVPGGGAFDGPLGVVSALLAVDELRARGVTPSVPVAVVCFVEEEGGRFGLPCLGSRLLTGEADADRVRALRDREGVALAEATPHIGVDPRHLGADPDRLARIGSFVELHVEQGRLLQATDPAAAVGVGSGIVAHGRWQLTLTGQGNHAGTTAPADRRDPMIPAAAGILAARQSLRAHPGAVATVGRIQPNPGGTNVIASSVQFWLDVRQGTSADTDAVLQDILRQVRSTADDEGCTLEVQQESMTAESHFHPELGNRLSTLLSAPLIPTGAGHDAGILAGHVPTAMIFVRNPSGISHAPEEFAETDDCLAGITALTDVLQDLALQEPAR